MRKFCAVILSHGRPDRVLTYIKLRQHGYTGPIIILVDNEDKTIDEYRNRFGDQVVVFDKLAAAQETDEGDNFSDRRAVVYARNKCFDVVKILGYTHFIMLDDDYYWFGHRAEVGAISTRELDKMFAYMVDFLETDSRIAAVTLSQGGDHIGGYNSKNELKRKAMNSFICSVERPFKFYGRLNEDVNAYVCEGAKGSLFFTVCCIQLDQKDSQSNANGLTDLYKFYGTYVKSFYSVLYAPSAVHVAELRSKHPRLHHLVRWENAVPKILSEGYRR